MKRTREQLLLVCSDEMSHHEIRIWFYGWLLKIINFLFSMSIAYSIISGISIISILSFLGTVTGYISMKNTLTSHRKFYKSYQRWQIEITNKPEFNQKDRDRYQEIYTHGFVHSNYQSSFAKAVANAQKPINKIKK